MCMTFPAAWRSAWNTRLGLPYAGDDEFLPLEQLEENTRMMAAAILRICGA
ncbi:MAG: hypothetical protein ACLUOF_03265 [Ruminococcus sp.]